MSCTACTKKYGFFCKESGCPNCGFSFCTKCLKKETNVPKCNGVKLKVCLKCFEKLEKEKLQPKKEVVDAAKLLSIDDPIESLAAPLEPIHPAEEVVPDEDKEIAENLDTIISKRLKNLKDADGKDLPSDTNMAERLAALKGVPYKEYSKADILLSTDKRTDKEKIDDLLKQFVDEDVIDEKVTNPLVDIERRLAALKGESSFNPEATGAKPKSNIPDTPSDNEENEEEQSKKIMEQFLEEAKLPDVAISEEEKEILQSLPPPSQETEELPWCTICNEDAITRCLGCDGDLFCKQCFGEIHDDEEYRAHQTKPYSKPPNFKEDHF